MEKAGFNIIGILVRTTNKDNQAAKDLDKLWECFFSENIMGKIPNKATSEVYADGYNQYMEGNMAKR
ncbi:MULTISPECIES: hypothetical protein [Chitinophagaceae]